jgi:hypothetical protein
MKKTALALFETQEEIFAALSELEENGIAHSQVKSFSADQTPAGGSQFDSYKNFVREDLEPTSSELYMILRQWNVPAHEALSITQTVRQGVHLASVIDIGEQLELIEDIFEKHNALSFDSCCQYFQERHTHPPFDDTTPPFLKIPQTSQGSSEVAGVKDCHPTQEHETVKFYEFQLDAELR